jgi:predicted transcriptional regulator
VLTRQDKEKLVIDLYNQGMPVREIAKELRMSFRDIGAILKKASGELEEKQSSSPSAQAYRLYSEGKSTLEVAIAQDLSEGETTRLYKEYLNLKHMDDLQIIYEEIGPDIMPFLELYKLSRDADMKPKHVVNLLQMSNEHLPLLELKYERLKKKIDSLESEKQKLRGLGSQVEVLTKVLEKYNKEIKNLQKEKIRLEILISGQYEKVRQIVEKEVNHLLSQRRDILKIAVASILESISQDPDRYNSLVNSNQYNGGGYAHPFIDAYRNLILDEAERLFELIKRDSTSRIINEPT